MLTAEIVRLGCPRLPAFMTNLTTRRTKIISSTSSRISVFMSWHIRRQTWLMLQVCTLAPCTIEFGTDILVFFFT